MLCFKCLVEVSGGVKALLNHLKYYHQINSGTPTRIICSQDGCMDTFSYTSSYKRHLLKMHKALVKANDTTKGDDQCSANVDQESNTGCEDVTMEECEEQDEGNDETMEDISQAVAFFIANMKASSVPFSFVQKVISETEILISSIVEHLKKKCVELCKKGKMILF